MDQPLVRSLQRLADEMMHRDIPPTFLPHHREERATPLADGLEVAQGHARDMLAGMTRDELAAEAASLHWFWSYRLSPERISEGEEFALQEGAFAYVCAKVGEVLDPLEDAVSAGREGESHVLTALPELKGRLDADGLVPLGADLDASDHAILYGEWVLQYSQFLRRGYRSAPNHDFLRRLALLRREHSDLKVSVAIDHGRLMSRAELVRLMERDHWRGPKWSEGQVDDPTHVGLTVYGRPPGADPVLTLQYPLLRCEFLTYMRENQKVLEMEELVPERALPKSVVVDKYVHSLRDTHARRFMHLDGAVRVYRKEDYRRRLGTDLRQGRSLALRYEKLFRVDGPIPDQDWAELVAHFYRGNELVREYLEGQ